jgi:hypothetical protein
MPLDHHSEEPTAIRTNLGAIFVSLELSRRVEIHVTQPSHVSATGDTSEVGSWAVLATPLNDSQRINARSPS